MARDVNLWQYLPGFLRRYKELDRQLAAEQPEFQNVVDQLEAGLDNLFIQSANETGLARFESLLGVYPSGSDSLDSRKARVMIHWVDLIPYTMRTLKDKIANIQGNANIEIYFSNPYEITIVTHLEKHGQVDNLAFLLKAVLPVNLAVVSDNVLEFRTQGGATTVYYGAATPITNMLFLTNDLLLTNSITGNANIGAGLSSTMMIKE